MSIPFRKYGYSVNPITDEIETPQIFLVTRKLKKIGELKPVDNLKITINEINAADEVSFTYYKKADNRDTPYFDRLVDLAVIQVDGYGFFEISVNKQESSYTVKTVTAQSLGISELSQKLASLEINTEEDIARTDYNAKLPTIFYRDPEQYIEYDWETLDQNNSPKRYIGKTDEETIGLRKKALRDSSLLHRICTYAPDYELGDIDESLWYIQRTFSWDNTDVMSVLNDAAEEIGCAFYIEVSLDEEGNAVRTINAYDMQYCSRCWDAARQSASNGAKQNVSSFRNIVNGVCQHCGKSDQVCDIGEDTNIFISTFNLSDEITLETDKDSLKNCFKITGGDDLMTNTVQGLNLSASGTIMEFSDDTKQLMTPELIETLESYTRESDKESPEYRKILEMIYNIYDLILWLESGRMPVIEEEVTTLDEALYQTIRQISDYFHNTFYISKYDYYRDNPNSTVRSSITNMFNTYIPKGYSFQIDTDSFTEADEKWESKKTYQWTGTIKFYTTGNKNTYYTLHVGGSQGSYITLMDSSKYEFESEEKNDTVQKFAIRFNFADKSQEAYMGYIQTMADTLLSEKDLVYENETLRSWNEYGYTPLEAYDDGFTSCIEALDDMKDNGFQDINQQIKENYFKIQSDISTQMAVRMDQIFVLYDYLGDFSSTFAKTNFVDAEGNIFYTLKKHSSVDKVWKNLCDETLNGGYNDSTFTPGYFIGKKAFKCLECSSTNVSDTSSGYICNNCQNTNEETLYTYKNMVNEVYAYFQKHNDMTLVKAREEMQKKFDLLSYFEEYRKSEGDGQELYHELMSFIREDVYNNSNYTSAGLSSNNEVIRMAGELMDKAKQELAKASTLQYTISTNLSSIVAQKPFEFNGILVNDDYSKFYINNYVRVKIDEEICKMRLSSMELEFPIQETIPVTFTNVTRYGSDHASDVADILASASSMATTYPAVTTQSEQGAAANNQFKDLKNEGLDAGLIAVKGGRDQDVVIDNHGILLRKKIDELNEYSRYQMKMINRNIVMTSNHWKDAELAIGLGMFDGEPRYGIWTDVIVGNLIAGDRLKIYGGGDGTTDGAAVVIDGNGITLDGGAVTWKSPIDPNAVKGLNEFEHAVKGSLGVTTITSDSVISPKIQGGYLYIADARETENTNTSVEINPTGTTFTGHKDDYVFNISKGNNVVMGVTNGGNGYFKGEITATSGYIGGEKGWKINDTSIINSGDSDSLIMTGDIDTVSTNKEGTFMGKGYIINGGNDSLDKDKPNYKLAWIHNGAIDLTRQPYKDSPYRTVITSDIIQGYCGANTSPWFHISNIDKTMFVDGETTFGDKMYIQNDVKIDTDISVNEIKIRTEETSSEAPNARFTTGTNPGHVRRSTASSKRYKHDITTVFSDELDPHKLYDINVVQYKYNSDYLGNDDIRYGKDVIGFIAEDIYEKYPIATDLTTKDGEKIPEDWNFRFILPGMLKLIQEQKQQIDSLEQRLSEKEKLLY